MYIFLFPQGNKKIWSGFDRFDSESAHVFVCVCLLSLSLSLSVALRKLGKMRLLLVLLVCCSAWSGAHGEVCQCCIES
jgi:hypothetical protein